MIVEKEKETSDSVQIHPCESIQVFQFSGIAFLQWTLHVDRINLGMMSSVMSSPYYLFFLMASYTESI